MRGPTNILWLTKDAHLQYVKNSDFLLTSTLFTWKKACFESLRIYYWKNTRYTLIQAAFLTLPMLRLLSCKAQGRKDFWKPSKPCHIGIHWIALTEYSQMSTHITGFHSFLGFSHTFVLAKYATSSIRVTVNDFIFQHLWTYFLYSKVYCENDSLLRTGPW